LLYRKGRSNVSQTKGVGSCLQRWVHLPVIAGEASMLSAVRQQNKPRVLIADDQAIVAAGVRKLLEPDCEVVGIVEDGRTLLEAAQKLRPNIIVLEVLLPQIHGIDAARQLTKLVPGSKLVFLTAQASPTVATEAFQAGASAYVLKRSPSSVLKQAIQAVMKGQQFVCPLMTRDPLATGRIGLESNAMKRPLSSLTSRQREVLQLIAEGRGTKEVASLLKIAVKTVEFHKFKIMEQLDLHSTVALAKRAITEGLVSP
jgi:DNA-binding NarL/FixJ family response regulator